MVELKEKRHNSSDKAGVRDLNDNQNLSRDLLFFLHLALLLCIKSIILLRFKFVLALFVSWKREYKSIDYILLKDSHIRGEGPRGPPT